MKQAANWRIKHFLHKANIGEAEIKKTFEVLRAERTSDVIHDALLRNEKYAVAFHNVNKLREAGLVPLSLPGWMDDERVLHSLA